MDASFLQWAFTAGGPGIAAIFFILLLREQKKRDEEREKHNDQMQKMVDDYVELLRDDHRIIDTFTRALERNGTRADDKRT